MKEIRELAEESLRTRSNMERVKITKAVIAVPAYFWHVQKQKTIEAAKLAGFEDVQLIAEPTAGQRYFEVL